MAYARRYKKSYARKSYRSRSYKSRPKRTNYFSTAQKALSLASHVASIVNSELKYYDETNNIQPSSTGDMLSVVGGIAAGTGPTNFEGNSILLKRLVGRASVIMNSSATATRIMLAIVQDRQVNQTTAPSYTQIWSTNTVNSLQNIAAYPGRFRILWRKYVIVDTSFPEKMVKFNLNMSRHIKFNTTTVSKNDFFLTYISDEATNTPTVNIQTRLRYYDN